MTSASVRCLFLVVSLGLGSSAMAQQPDWVTKVLDAWNQNHLQVTKMSADKANIVLPGTKFVLKKGGLGLARTYPGRLDILDAMNFYEDGLLRPQFPTLFEEHAKVGRGRIMAPGDKVWLSGITNYKSKELWIEVVTDPYKILIGADSFEIVRYWGYLKFRAPKGTQPDPEQIIANFKDLLVAEDSSPAGTCNGLKTLVSRPPKTIEYAVILPAGSPLNQESRESMYEYHTEGIEVSGDQTQTIHPFVQQCLSNFKVDSPAAANDGAIVSTLTNFDPPYDMALSTIARKDQNHTTVVFKFRRWENPTQLRLDYATIAYVATASPTCGWSYPTHEQAVNVNRYQSVIAEWFTDELALANKHMESKGRLDFCADPAEKAKFDRLAATIWPTGNVGKP